MLVYARNLYGFGGRMEYETKIKFGDIEVDDNSVATFTKEAKNEEGRPFLAPSGVSTVAAEAASKDNQ